MLYIFDWDGTLCDSTDRIVGAMQQAAEQEEAPMPTQQAVRDVIGLGLPEAMAIVFPTLTLGQQDRMREVYSKAYVELDRVPAGLFPSVSQTLQELRGRGHSLAIATGKGRRGLDRVLEGLDLSDFFDATRCADEAASKPDPLMLEQLLQELSVPTAQAVVIGDSEFDLEMARNAGIASYGVSWGVHSRQRLMRHDPVAVLDEVGELLRITGA